MSHEATLQFNIPVCLFVFKRLEPVKMIFDIFKQVRPSKIYVFADGPREHVEGEADQVKEVREYVQETIDWDCEKELFFFEENKGCDKNIIEGLILFFSKEEKGIIFEDDAVPVKEFFSYCEYLLNKYEVEDKIQYIAGFNAIGDSDIIKDDYTFGKTAPLSGAFATWSDRWNNCDFEIKDWPEEKKKDLLNSIFFYSEQKKIIINCLDEEYKGVITAWDYKFDFDMYKKNRLAIVPKGNLATSYGYLAGAFHPQEKGVVENLIKLMTATEDKISFPLSEPVTITRNEEYDRLRQKLMLGVKGNLVQRRAREIFLFIKNIAHKILPKNIWDKIKRCVSK